MTPATGVPQYSPPDEKDATEYTKSEPHVTPTEGPKHPDIAAPPAEPEKEKAA